MKSIRSGVEAQDAYAGAVVLVFAEVFMVAFCPVMPLLVVSESTS